MLRYTQPSSPIRDKYTNLPKGHKIEYLILVGEGNISLRRKGVEEPVYYFFHGNFPDVEFFALRRYIHVIEEGPEESIFDPTEALACQRSVIQPIYGTVIDNRISGINKEGNLYVLPSGKNTNPMVDNMAIIFPDGNTMDEDYDGAPENIPEQQHQ